MVDEQLEEEKFLSISEELNQMITVVGSKEWIVVSCCCALMLLLLIWSFLGLIPIKASGWGILLPPEGENIVVAKTSGVIAEIIAAEGQIVQKDEVIVRLIKPRTYLDIQLQKTRVAEAEDNLATFIKTVNEENHARLAVLQKKIDSAELAKNNTLSRIPFLKEDLAAKKKLAEQGILARPDFEKANSDLLSAYNDISAYTAEIADFRAEVARKYRQGEIEQKKETLSLEKDKLDRLLLEQTFTVVRSPRAGKILEIVVTNGEELNEGSLIATMEPIFVKISDLKFYALVSKHGVLIKKGLTAQIEMAGIPPKSYGYLLGEVTDVSAFPVSDDGIMTVVENKELIEFLKNKNTAVYALYIKPHLDPKSIDGFKWTIKKGPPNKLDAGNLGIARIIIQEKRPIFYVLPEKIGPYVQKRLRISLSPQGSK